MGSVLPLGACLLANVSRVPGRYLFRLFAGFGLAANGSCMIMGPSESEADTGVMIRNGPPGWLLSQSGLSALSLGLFLWHREGPHLRFGKAEGKLRRLVMIIPVLLPGVITGVGLGFDRGEQLGTALP